MWKTVIKRYFIWPCVKFLESFPNEISLRQTIYRMLSFPSRKHYRLLRIDFFGRLIFTVELYKTLTFEGSRDYPVSRNKSSLKWSLKLNESIALIGTEVFQALRTNPVIWRTLKLTPCITPAGLLSYWYYVPRGGGGNRFIETILEKWRKSTVGWANYLGRYSSLGFCVANMLCT